jgi:BASS family bile acid:Na+ symporter
MNDIINNAPTVLAPLVLAFLMISLGLRLTTDDFLRVVKIPKAFGVGILNQMIILPVVAIIIAVLLRLEPIFATGLVLAALCPGGVTTSYITKLAKGDVALSVSLTAVMSIIIMLTIPISLTLAMQYFMGSETPSFSVSGIAMKMATMTTIPVIIGMLIYRYLPTFTEKIRSGVEKTAIILFGFVLAISIFSTWGMFVDNISSLALASILLMSVMLFIGYKSPFWFGLGEAQARTVAIEAPYQNPIVGFAVAGLVLPNEAGGLSILAAPCVVYGILMFPVVLGTIYWIVKFKK